MKLIILARNFGRSIRLGKVLNGAAIALQRVTSTSTALVGSEFLKGGAEALRNSYTMSALLLAESFHWSDSTISEAMKKAMSLGRPSESKIVIVGTPSSLSSRERKSTSLNFVFDSALTTTMRDGDWQEAGVQKN